MHAAQTISAASRSCSPSRGVPGLKARCALWSHQFGWVLGLTVNDSVIRTQVGRVFAEILTASGEWQAAMRAQGWE
jgi:hypothetical protein